jgi:uncharacterized protein YecE (DUF72 family)
LARAVLSGKIESSRHAGVLREPFATVEINNSFYRLPPIKALKHWYDSTPPGFCFAVKGSRYLTHMKKLKDPKPGLAKFFSRIDHLAGC